MKILPITDSINKKSTHRGLGAIFVSLSFVFATAQPAFALSGKMNKDLQKLEIKFFEHKYNKEPDEKRIERIEKLVFGESKTGLEPERIQALVNTVPELKNDKLDTKPKSLASNKTSQPAPNASNEDAAPTDPSVDYPRVDSIEQTVLGKVFKNEPLGKRLDQLELKAFKKSSNNPDLSKRVDQLEKYVRKHYHKSVSQMIDPRNSLNYRAPMGASNSAYRAPAYAGSGSSSGSYGMTPPPVRSYSRNAPSDRPPSLSAPVTQQLAWLENHVYGHSFPQKPLIDRVRALEKTVFPSEPPDTSSSIPMQVKVLVNAVELMHRSPNSSGSPGSPSSSSTQTANSNTGSQFPNWPPKNSAAYGGYASQNQVGANTNTSNSSGAFYPQNQRQYDSGAQNYQQTQPQYGANQAAAQNQNQYQPPQKKHGHPLLKSLAKSLLTVGAVAAGSMLGGGYYGGSGYGGMGGLNRGGYGYGNSGYGNSYGRRGIYF